MAKKPLRNVLAGVKSSKVVKLDHKDMYQWNSPDGLKFIDDKHPVEKHADRVGNGDDVYTGSTKPAKYPRQDASVYEEAEELDEISMKRAAEYDDAAQKDIMKHVDKIYKPGGHEAGKRIAKRVKGQNLARDKMRFRPKNAKVRANEETDGNITDQKLGAGEEKTAIFERKYLERAAERVAGTKRRANQKLEDIARYERKRKENMERQSKEFNKERDEEIRKREKDKRKRDEERKRRLKKQKPHHVKEETTFMSFLEHCGCECNHSKKGVKCDVHGKDECPTNEAIEIGKALRIGNQFTDSHLAANKRNPNSLGKPANLLDRANKTIGKLKGSTFMVKKMTEEEQIDEVAPPDPKIEKWIKDNKERFVKEYGPKKGKEVLYAKAWKMHGRSESGSPATNSDYVGPGAAGWTTGRLDTGTL